MRPTCRPPPGKPPHLLGGYGALCDRPPISGAYQQAPGRVALLGERMLDLHWLYSVQMSQS